MGTHPIFESDFDCLTDPSNRSQWSSDLLIDVDWLTTPPLTVARSSRRPAESSFISEWRRLLPSQSVATPRSPSEASELSDREKLPSFLDDRRLSPERTGHPLRQRRPIPNRPSFPRRRTEDGCQDPQGQAGLQVNCFLSCLVNKSFTGIS